MWPTKGTVKPGVVDYGSLLGAIGKSWTCNHKNAVSSLESRHSMQNC
jgi:hypothetical protein